MGSLQLHCLTGVLVFLHVSPVILGWGYDGHYATCKIAEAYLTEEASTAVQRLLPASADGRLASVCSWPDQIRNHYPWSKELHFADTPDFVCKYEYCRDCHDSSYEAHRCVTGAMYNYTQQLILGYSGKLPEGKYNLTEALMFLSHFVGDAHQPLHIGFEGDRGGNDIKLEWYNKITNLHSVWDSAIIDTAVDRLYGSNLTNMIEAVKGNITDDWSDEVNSWKHCHDTACPNRYAAESVHLACKYAYKNATPGSQLDDEYFYSRLPVVEKRLAKGGIRLAATLNRIFTSHSYIPKQAFLVM